MKPGLKNPKWTTSIKATNTDTPNYWKKPGFNWFSGTWHR